MDSKSVTGAMWVPFLEEESVQPRTREPGQRQTPGAQMLRSDMRLIAERSVQVRLGAEPAECDIGGETAWQPQVTGKLSGPEE